MGRAFTLLLVLSLISLFACNGSTGPAGATGPQGPAGPTGSQGPSGNSNISTNIIKVATSDFSASNSYVTEADYSESVMTAGIVDSGLVFAYASQDQGTHWTALPLSYEGTSSSGTSLTVTLNFGFYPGYFALVIVSTEANNNTAHAALFDGYWVKFVILPKTASSMIKGIDTNNYIMMMKAIGK